MNKVMCWCEGVIERISDGTWLRSGARTKCYKENEAAYIHWDPIPELNMAACKGNQELLERKWNKDFEGAWRQDLGEEDYGLS